MDTQSEHGLMRSHRVESKRVLEMSGVERKEKLYFLGGCVR